MVISRLILEWMLELTPLLSPQFQQTELGGRQGPRTPQDKESVKREIEATDKVIDRLVSPAEISYELSSHKGMIYGLTEDDVKAVEGKLSKAKEEKWNYGKNF